MGDPVLLVIEGDADALAEVGRELEDRYGRHYNVISSPSPADARSRLEECAASGCEVALVLAGAESPDESGNEVLEAVRDLHPHAKRALLVGWEGWGDKTTGRAIFTGISDGQFDHYVLRPVHSPDELFHNTVSGMLLEWAEANRAAPYTVQIVGESWTGRAYELREALQQCAVVHNFCLADSEEGREIVASVGTSTKLPFIKFPTGEVLENPTNAEIALATGGPIEPGRMEFDLIIIGAGPAGLSAAVYGASEGFSTLVVDRGGIGGQATSSSLIRNYLGFPRGITGRQLAQNAYNQAWVFGADFAFMQTVTAVSREDEQLLVTVSDLGPLRTTAVLLTTGASYRRLGLPSIEALLGAGVFYGGSTSEAPGMAGRDVFIVGGANSAGQAALHLARYARKVTIVVRAGTLRAGMSDYLVRQIEGTANIEVRLGTQIVDGGGDGRLERLVLRDLATRDDVIVAADALFCLIGAQPNTSWLPPEIACDNDGFVLTGPDLPEHLVARRDRRPLLLETSLPGVFAAGDVRHGAVKRVASAVGEGSIAVQLLHQFFAAAGHQPRGIGYEAAAGSVERTG
ncbi:MAG: FAD-dependent oxidoreductase [Acidimicrobiia bacterium]|nr:FAD-dependent oxidoreductase [Acidimicrobiia bacterium]